MIRDIVRYIRVGIRRKLKNKKAKVLFRRSGSELMNPYIITNCKYVRVGKNVRIKDFARIECYDSFCGIQLFPILEIGDGVIINNNFTCFVANTVHIGKDSIFAHNVMITSENHGVDPESELPYHAQPLVTRPVYIGNNCWIGANVSILCGASIGNNCIVGANSIVNKSFPDNCMIAGNPARIIKVYDYNKHRWERQ